MTEVPQPSWIMRQWVGVGRNLEIRMVLEESRGDFLALEFLCVREQILVFSCITSFYFLLGVLRKGLSR